MSNCWKISDLGSGKNPPEFAAGEPPPTPFPPDPPDSSSPLSPLNFPPLSSQTPTGPKRHSRKGSYPSSVPALSIEQGSITAIKETPVVAGNGIAAQMESAFTGPLSRSENSSQTVTISEKTFPSSTLTTNPTEPHLPSPKTLPPSFATLPPSSSSPIFTNKAATVHLPPLLPSPNLPVPPSVSPAVPSTSAPSLVEKIRASEDKSLSRLAPVTISASGRPRVLIPDSVFEKGAEIHKDFIICYYNGKAPPYNQIQSVFNHLWGKGKKLEIHNNPLNRTTIVRIQSAYLRQKILEKCIWYVGDTMFHTEQWSSSITRSSPPLKAIKIWAHLTGVPLDLRYQKGLSLVAGLIGEPKETDAFTLNMVSLTVSHVKVEVDLTKALPSVVEFERQSGEVVEVSVSYPWVPPTCSHCKEMGHIVRNCLTYTPPPPEKDPDLSTKTPRKEPKLKGKMYRPVVVPDPVAEVPIPIAEVASLVPLASCSTSQDPSSHPIHNPLLPSPMDFTLSKNPFNLLSSPDPVPRPSLKRSRSSPTFSPPLSANPNPFKNSVPLAISFPSSTEPPTPSSSRPSPFVPLPPSTSSNPFDVPNFLVTKDSSANVGPPLLS